jgi:Na+/melibiose symporter-like transporter
LFSTVFSPISVIFHHPYPVCSILTAAQQKQATSYQLAATFGTMTGTICGERTILMNTLPHGKERISPALHVHKMQNATEHQFEVTRYSTGSVSRAPSLASATNMTSKDNSAFLEPGNIPNTSELGSNNTAIETAPVKRSRPSLSTVLAFVALCLSIFLVALDTVLIPTALPTIALSFQIRDSLYAWIGSAYLLANAASVPLWGKLSDVFGRKPVILTANLIFLAGSIICALSTNAIMLLAGRVVQGFGGGGVVVLVHVCVSDLFSIRYVVDPLPALAQPHHGLISHSVFPILCE